MSTDWGRGAATIGSFMIKYFGGDHIAVHIGKAGWQVPEGEPVTVLMQIDRAPAMRAQGYGVSLGGVSGLEIRIDGNDTWAATGKNAITEFVSLLGTGRQIVVSFPDGTEVPWVGRLDGARAALKSFSACGETIDAAKAPGTTQPFGRAPQPAPGATQPFGRAPEPAPTTVTQPYHKL
jgi:hypothetical protein